MPTGYTRQSSAGIVTSNTILASHFNTEFDALQAAFDTSSGHNHDGTAGGGAPIILSNLADVDLVAILANTRANQPAAGTKDRMYVVTDEDTIEYDDGINWNTVGGAGKVTSNDTSPGPLNTKITVSGDISKTVTNPGADERLNLSVSAPVAPVDSVAGKTGVVTLSTTDVSGLGSQALYNQTISTGNPSGGASGDVWYKV